MLACFCLLWPLYFLVLWHIHGLLWLKWPTMADYDLLMTDSWPTLVSLQPTRYGLLMTCFLGLLLLLLFMACFGLLWPTHVVDYFVLMAYTWPTIGLLMGYFVGLLMAYFGLLMACFGLLMAHSQPTMAYSCSALLV